MTTNATGSNRANAMGEALEDYIKNAFANTFSSIPSARLSIFNQEFSWLGSQNNPPDIIINGGDAIEVKKIQGTNSSLALNSSYPKDKVYANSPMITAACRACENWTVKDIIYCIGHVPAKTTAVKSLWMVYGSIYAADSSIYERIKSAITNGITTIPNVAFTPTKELGRVNNVDPLKITNLRIRGMWQIKNPKKVFHYLHQETTTNTFELVVIVPLDKYNSFPATSQAKINSINKNGFKITDVKVQDPNNPAKLIDCKLIIYTT